MEAYIPTFKFLGYIPHMLAVLEQISTGAILLFTNVYGPSVATLKPAFIEESRSLSLLVNQPWIIGGDFNLVHWLIDRSGSQRSFRLMDLFNDLIRDLQLVDVPLSNRQFTWCNNIPEPTHSRLDRIFLSPDMAAQFPSFSLKATEVLASDHAPLILSLIQQRSTKRHFKMELFWLKNPEATYIIHTTWNEISQLHTGGIQKFNTYYELLHSWLRSWHCTNFTEIEKQLKFCRNTLLFSIGLRKRDHWWDMSGASD